MECETGTCAWSPPPELVPIAALPEGSLPQGPEFRDSDGALLRYYTDPTFRGPEYLRVREGKAERWFQLGGSQAA